MVLTIIRVLLPMKWLLFLIISHKIVNMLLLNFLLFLYMTLRVKFLIKLVYNIIFVINPLIVTDIVLKKHIWKYIYRLLLIRLNNTRKICYLANAGVTRYVIHFFLLMNFRLLHKRVLNLQQLKLILIHLLKKI